MQELAKLLVAEENETNNFLYEHQFRLALARVQSAANKSYYVSMLSDDSTVEDAEAACAHAHKRLEMAQREFKSAELSHAKTKEQIEAKKEQISALTSSPSLVQ